MSGGLKTLAVAVAIGLICTGVPGCGSDSSSGPDGDNHAITVTDIDGNVYQTTTIGSQVWMAENLKVTHYRNGEAIPNVSDSASWAGLSTGAYCEYDNDLDSVEVYGRLYNRFAVITVRNIAPEGWHVPTDDEWQILADYLGGRSVAGGKMKATGTTYWSSPNTGATNECGFSALPAGSRYPTGSYGNKGDIAIFWSSTGNRVRSISATSSELDRTFTLETAGLSVRLIKD